MLQIIPSSLTTGDALLVYLDLAKPELGGASYPENHLGLNRLASYLDARGWRVGIVNTTGVAAKALTVRAVAEWLRPQLAAWPVWGFHLTSWNVSHVVELVQTLGEQIRDHLIVFGGPLATAVPEQIIQLFYRAGLRRIAVVAGYGEYLLEEILRSPQQLEKIPGLWFSDGARYQAGSLQRFNAVQLSARSSLNLKYNTFYQQYYAPALAEGGSTSDVDALFAYQGLDVNQGCPFACTYCSVPVFGRSVVEYAPERVVQEIKSLAAEAGFFWFTFTNSNVQFVRREWLREFCTEIKRQHLSEYLNWTGYHHPLLLDKLTPEDWRLLRSAGCSEIALGVQSVEPAILRYFGREAAAEAVVRRVIEQARASGVRVVIDYIRGVPGENLTAIRHFYNFCFINEVEVREFQLKLYPQAALWEQPLDWHGFDLVPIMGSAAPGLDSYAVVARTVDPLNAELFQELWQHNATVRATRPLRLGEYVVTNIKDAQRWVAGTAANNKHIPPRVIQAWSLFLKMWAAESGKQSAPSPAELLKTILRDVTPPPMVKALQDKLRAEWGEEKYARMVKESRG